MTMAIAMPITMTTIVTAIVSSGPLAVVSTIVSSMMAMTAISVAIAIARLSIGRPLAKAPNGAANVRSSTIGVAGNTRAIAGLSHSGGNSEEQLLKEGKKLSICNKEKLFSFKMVF